MWFGPSLWHFLQFVCINTWSEIYAKWPNQTMKIGDKCGCERMCELLLHLSYDNTKPINNIIKNRGETSFSAFPHWLLSPSSSSSSRMPRNPLEVRLTSHRRDYGKSKYRHFHSPNQAQIHLEWHIIKHNKIALGIDSTTFYPQNWLIYVSSVVSAPI